MQLTRKMKRLLRDYAVKRLLNDGHKKIALYGAGRHTEHFLEQLAQVEELEVVLLLDDAYTEPASKFEYPVKASAAFEGQEADAVLLSSDGFEDKL